jgi:hypothetical protein
VVTGDKVCGVLSDRKVSEVATTRLDVLMLALLTGFGVNPNAVRLRVDVRVQVSRRFGW